MEIICLNNYKAKYSHTGNLSLIRFFIPVVIYVIKYFEVEVEVVYGPSAHSYAILPSSDKKCGRSLQKCENLAQNAISCCDLDLGPMTLGLKWYVDLV